MAVVEKPTENKPEEIKATEEVKAPEPVIEKTPEELEKEKLEKEELIKKRQKMLMELANNGNEEMDFGEGPGDEPVNE